MLARLCGELQLSKRERVMKTGNVLIAIGLISAVACGGGGGSTGPSGNTTPPLGGISVTNNVFSPSAKTVAVGNSVSWSWNSCTDNGYSGQTCVSHNVVFDDGVTSGLMDQGSYTRTFTAAGTYNYHCAVHGQAMSGTITVQ